MKTCSKCGEEKELRAFRVDSISKRNGVKVYNSKCRECLAVTGVVYKKKELIAKQCVICNDWYLTTSVIKKACTPECAKHLARRNYLKKVADGTLNSKSVPRPRKKGTRGEAKSTKAKKVDPKYLTRGKIHYEGHPGI